jgi:hypothetical protein
MIIREAYRSLELEKNNTIDKYCNWEYLSIKVGNDTYRMVFELNKAYGMSLLRQWMVNDKTETDVINKYIANQFVNFDCSNGLCGVRDFEFCISYEFCLKPMGIPLDDIQNRPYNWSLSPYELKNILKKNNIDFEIIFEGTY